MKGSRITNNIFKRTESEACLLRFAMKLQQSRWQHTDIGETNRLVEQKRAPEKTHAYTVT